MKKTGWTNFLACFLGFSAASGVGNLFVMLQDDAWQATVLAGFVAVYVLCTLAASYALFAAKNWATKAIGIWAVALMLTIIPIQYWVIGLSLLDSTVMVIVVSFILYKIYKYIGRCANAH